MKDIRLALRSSDIFGRVAANLGIGANGRLMLSMTFSGKPVFEDSPLGITVDGVDLGVGVALGEPERGAICVTYPWRGHHSIAADQCVTISVPVIHLRSQTAYNLEMRFYEDALAYRYNVPGEGPRQVAGEATGWQLPAAAYVWYQTNTANYEAVHERRQAGKAVTDRYIGPPLTIELPKGAGYAAITEAGLFDYSGMTLKHKGKGFYQATFDDNLDGWTMHNRIRSPWRVILASADLNGLVNSDVIHNLCPPPSPALRDATWIKPGRCVWSWWSWWDGKSPFYLPYDTTRERGFIDAAAALGFEYTLVDAGWDSWSDGDKDCWALLRELVDYAAERNVGVWVWRHYSKVIDPEDRHAFLSKLKSVGAVGVKVDFMDCESKFIIDFYTDMMKETAAHQLMVNFHGANKPTGESRTWPNEMTREGIFGLEQNKIRVVPPHHNASLPFTRFLAGHADYTPCTFNPEMMKGTTASHQLATAIVFLSPVTHWADHPSRYLESGLQDIISAIPTVWDETRVLPMSQIGELAVFARRKGSAWFVGVVNGGDAKTLSLPLDFLGKGDYRADIIRDGDHGPESFVRYAQAVTARTTIAAELAAGGGLVLRIRTT